MEWLRIEFGGEALDALSVDADASGPAEGLCHFKVFQVSLGHFRRLLGTRPLRVDATFVARDMHDVPSGRLRINGRRALSSLAGKNSHCLRYIYVPRLRTPRPK